MATRRAKRSGKTLKALPAKSLTAGREKAVKAGTDPSNGKTSRWGSVKDGTSNTVFF